MSAVLRRTSELARGVAMAASGAYPSGWRGGRGGGASGRTRNRGSGMATTDAAAAHTASHVPHAVFTVDDAAPAERFALWRESISCIFDVEADADLRREDFAATVDAHMFGTVMLAQTSTLRQAWARRATTIARDGMDHYMIQLFLEGGMEAEHRHGTATMKQNGLIVFDLSQEMESRTDSMTNLSLIVSREMLGPLLGAPDEQHMRTLDTREPLVALLAQHMLGLRHMGPRITAAQGVELGPATAALAAACLNGTPRDTPGAQLVLDLAHMTRIKREIERRLDDPELSVETIARLVGASRSKLYAMFEPLGGVGTYVRERRLRRALLALVDERQDHRPIYDIALDCGFTSESAFSRSFRRRFGSAPREVRRERAVSERAPSGVAGLDRRYEHWLSHLAP